MPSEVLIGLDAGAETIVAVAFDGDGGALQTVSTASPVARLEHGAEQDLGDTWKAAAQTLRRLATVVPDLARRAMALAITGQGGGTWLIDEDGDPVAPGAPAPARRAISIAERWRQTGIAAKLQAITGAAPDITRPSAQLAWLLRHRPEVLERAATAFAGKDWLYFCCTGERATDAAEAIPSFGNRRTRAYDPSALELLGLEEIRRLLPAIVDGARHQGALSRAAAAACGLRAGTPVLLAPPDLVTRALAAGLGEPGHELAASIFGATTCHLRLVSERHEGADPDQPPVAHLPFVLPRTALAVSSAPGMADLEWLLDLGAQLLADAGLIGIGRADLQAMLERKTARARPGALLVQPFATDHGVPESPAARARAHILGLGRETTVYDLMRGLHEGQGFAARASHAALGARPAEIRLIEGPSPSPLARAILAACVGAPVRVVERTAPGAAGAALLAAVALGRYRSIGEATSDWVLPWLGAIEPVDPELQARYAQLYPIQRGAHPVTAEIAQALDRSDR